MSRALVTALAIILACSCGSASAECLGDRTTSVVIAKVAAMRVHGREEARIARSQYVHENLQPLVAEIQQTLLGPALANTVVVFLDVDPAPQFKIEWLGSYGMLSPSEWRIGDTFVMVLTSHDRYNIPCQTWVPSSKRRGQDEVNGVPVLEEIPVFPQLAQFEDYPGYCASLRSVFRVKLNPE